MKYLKPCIVFLLLFLFTSCSNTLGNDAVNVNTNIVNALSSEIIMRSGDESSAYFIKQKKDYYNYVIETVKSNCFVKKDGSEDNLDGLSYTLKQCAYQISEPLGNRELIPIVQNPDNGLYVAEFNYGGMRAELLLISFTKGEISFIKEIGEVNRNSTSMVSLKGFDEKFIQTFTATNMGNGDMKLISFDNKAQVVSKFKVIDNHFENSNRLDINGQYNLDENESTSYIFGDIDEHTKGNLYPNYIDINNDGYDDVQFTGVQTLYDSKMREIDQFNVTLTYIYDFQHKTFNLSEEKSILPHMWNED